MLPAPLQPKKKPEPEIKSVVFGFGHRARSGKNTAVAEIVRARSIWTAFANNSSGLPDNVGTTRTGLNIKPYSFAMALKLEVNQAAEAAGGMERLFDPMEFIQENGNAIVLPEWVKFDPNPPMDDPLCPYGKQRLLLQFWGTEFRRNVNQNYWVQRLAEIIAKEQPQFALISDMRFPNEKEFVEKYGFSIRVDRDSHVPLSGAAASHPSELALADVPDWDWSAILKNDSTLEEFKTKAVKLFDTLAPA